MVFQVLGSSLDWWQKLRLRRRKEQRTRASVRSNILLKASLLLLLEAFDSVKVHLMLLFRLFLGVLVTKKHPVDDFVVVRAQLFYLITKFFVALSLNDFFVLAL